jgi:DNA-binding transcriptional regulator/RsmH inhibitor MraZ
VNNTSTQGSLPADTPRGLRRVHVDEFGRMKLPRDFSGYLAAVGATTLFLTCLEDGVVRIYPLVAWMRHRAALFELGTQTARNIQFLAEDRGSDVTIDKLGRLTVPDSLLEVLGRGNQEIVLEFYCDRINVYNQTSYVRQRELAQQVLTAGGLSVLEQQGLL